MPDTNLEIIQKAIEDFIKIQRHMVLARKENATETYASLKKRIFLFEKLSECCRCKSYGS